MDKVRLTIELSSQAAQRLNEVASKRSVSIEALAEAYVEDWLCIEYAELKGRYSRRAIYQDGPIAFDQQVREAAGRVEQDILESEKKPSAFNPTNSQAN